LAKLSVLNSLISSVHTAALMQTFLNAELHPAFWKEIQTYTQFSMHFLTYLTTQPK